jgi:hypothetical protein
MHSRHNVIVYYTRTIWRQDQYHNHSATQTMHCANQSHTRTSGFVSHYTPAFIMSTFYTSYKLEFITNLMYNFIYSIIKLHHDPQHVSCIAVLIFKRTIVYLQYLGSSHSVWQHTECDDTRYCKYTIVLLKMSTAMHETC